MNALRLAAGFQPALFEARTAQPLTRILPQLRAAAADGLVDIGRERIAPTPRGRRFLNVLLERFLDEDRAGCDSLPRLRPSRTSRLFSVD